MGLTEVLCCVLISVIFTSWFIPQILIVAFKKRLFDFADARKVHSGIVPRLGGIAFVPSILITLSLIVGVRHLLVGESGLTTDIDYTLKIALCLCGLILLYFEGIMDDLVGLRYKVKFVIQLLCATLIVMSGIYLNDFQGLFGIHAIPLYVGVPLSVVLIVFIINAINLIDGIDGLASGLCIVSSFFLGVIFFTIGLIPEALLAFALFGTLLPFFYYNVFGDAQKRRKIFMGDTGSQCVGLVMAILAVRLSMNIPEIHEKIDGSIIVAFSMLLVPAFDVIRVMIHRYRRHKNMFEADKSHIHHKLLMLGMSHKATMGTILIVAMLFVLLNLVLLQYINVNIILVLDVLVWTVAHLILTRAINKRREGGELERY